MTHIIKAPKPPRRGPDVCMQKSRTFQDVDGAYMAIGPALPHITQAPELSADPHCTCPPDRVR